MNIERFKQNLEILKQHNITHIPVYHLTDGKVFEKDLINAIVADGEHIIKEIENNELTYILPPIKQEYEIGYNAGKADTILQNHFSQKLVDNIECAKNENSKEVAKDIIKIIRNQCGWKGEIDDWLIALAINEICDKYNIPEEKISEEDLADMEEHVRLEIQ